MSRALFMPVACAVLSITGLLLALVSDGGTEAIGVLAVIVPLLLLVWKLR